MTITSDIKEIYHSRSILRALVSRNLFGKYRNSFLGFIWHFFNPIIMLCVYFLAFSVLRETDIEDNWIFIASGIFIFHFMLHNIVSGTSCIVNQSGMVSKMYFPRAIIPLANVISTFIIALIGYAIIIATILVSGHGLDLMAFLMFPIALVLAFIFSLGCILIFSSVAVYVRDLQHLLTSVSMVFYFLTPMYFMVDETGGMVQTIVWCNPLTYYVEICHDALYWGRIPDISVIIIAVILAFAALTIGMFVFQKLEHRMAEKI